MIELYRHLTQEKANICSLVLKSSGIFHRVKQRKNGWVVWIRSTDAVKAQAIMAAYFEENPHREFINISENSRKPALYNGIWVAIVLLAFYLATGEDKQPVHDSFGSSAQHILNGEIYRTVTSLFLHADAVHLVGNMAAIVLFGSAVFNIHGLGIGLLLILLTGIMGNAFNAILYQTHHISVGASTAVFGAIGILSAYQFWRKIHLPGERMKAWLPLGGGLALLALLGSGEGRVDVMAHLFGFFAGLVMETFYMLWGPAEASQTVQWICITIAAVMTILSWSWPLWLAK